MINVNWWIVWCVAGLLIVNSLGWLITGLRNRFLKKVVRDLQWRNIDLKDALMVGLKNYQYGERMVFLAIIHNLKSTLSGIKMAVSGDMDTGTMRRSFKSIELAATDALHQTKSILNNSFHRTDGDKLPMIISAKFSPLITLQKLSKKIQKDINHGHCEIKIELAKKGQEQIQNRLDNFRGNEDLLRSIFENLIINACEAIKISRSRNRTVTVLIDLVIKEAEEWLKFSITNEGRIPPELLEDFLKKQVVSSKENGSGMGSYLAAMTTKLMRGKIYLNIQDTERVDISIEIPTTASLER